MSNLHTESGENNCYWNVRGTCTNPIINRHEPTAKYGSGRDWDSKLNCTLTQYGAQKVCSGYKLEEL